MAREELLEVIREELAAQHRRLSVPDDVTVEVWKGLEHRLRFRAGGSELTYIRRRQDTSARDADIRRRFNGRNANELGRDHNISARYVRKIAKGK